MKMTQNIKKTLLLFVALLTAFSASAYDYDFSAKNSDGVYIYYNITSSKSPLTVEVTHNDSYVSAGYINIPSTVTYSDKTYTVTAIGSRAFNGIFSTESISIPETVTSIGEYAFSGCTSLTNITLPNSVTSIGVYAFYKCTSLANITLPNSLTSIGNSAFYKCTSLTNITLPNSLTSIEYGAFCGCTSLANITLPNSLTSIGYGAFDGCTSLTNVTLPKSLTTIGGDAFYKCTSLTSIAIPNTISLIDVSTFEGCTGLTSVIVGKNVETISEKAFYNCTNLAKVINYSSLTFLKGSYSYGYIACYAKEIIKGVLPESVTLNKRSFELKVGETETLVPTVLPENTTDKIVTLSSSNESVATVDQYGMVRAISPGTAIIMATCGDVYETCQVYVKPITAETIILSNSSLSLWIGEMSTIVATVLPEDATEKTITWKSYNEKIVSVDYNGMVRGLSAGSTTILATCGNAYATCDVTVYEVKAQSITLNKDEIELKRGDSYKLIATVLPYNATDQTVSWSSSDKDVATVGSSGKVMAIKVGKATITATCGEVYTTCEVTVVDESSIETLSADEDGREVEVFTLQGVKVADKDLAPGVYIRRVGDKAEKVLIR